MYLVRPITLFALKYNFTLTALHFEGPQNGMADSLSHFQMERLRELAPEASPTGYPHPGIPHTYRTSSLWIPLGFPCSNH